MSIGKEEVPDKAPRTDSLNAVSPGEKTGRMRKVELDLEEFNQLAGPRDSTGSGKPDGRTDEKKVALDLAGVNELSREKNPPGAGDSTDRPPDPEDPPVKEPPQAAAARRFKLRTILIIAITALIFGAAAVAGLLSLLGKTDGENKNPAADQGVMLNLEPFIINYPESDGEAILKLAMVVTFSNPEAKQEFSANKLFQREMIYRHLLTWDPAGFNDKETIPALRQELSRVINSSLKRGEVKDILFQEFLLI